MIKPTPTYDTALARRNADFKTLPEALDYAAKGKRGLNFYSPRGELENSITFAQIRKRSNEIGRRLVHFGIKKKLTIDDLGYLLGPIINAGGRLGYSNYATELLSTDNPNIIKKKSIDLIKLNNKRKILEQNILNKINFDKIKQENKNVIIYYKDNIHEGLIGIIAAKLKDYFNKPSIVLTNSNNILKGSARSTPNYNIGQIIKKLLDKKIIENGGGHNMAGGFTIKKNNFLLLDNFIQKDFSNKILAPSNEYKYDSEISMSIINNNFINELNRLGPFGSYNLLPIFFINDFLLFKQWFV